MDTWEWEKIIPDSEKKKVKSFGVSLSVNSLIVSKFKSKKYLRIAITVMKHLERERVIFN